MLLAKYVLRIPKNGVNRFLIRSNPAPGPSGLDAGSSGLSQLQKINFRANCKTRGDWAVVIFPYVVPASPNAPYGTPKDLISAKSRFTNPGPRMKFREELPSITPAAGSEKSLVLNQQFT